MNLFEFLVREIARGNISGNYTPGTIIFSLGFEYLLLKISQLIVLHKTLSGQVFTHKNTLIPARNTFLPLFLETLSLSDLL